VKIRTLRLVAYGPFTDASIDFSDPATDFHLVFGPNEAGKSSALRALRHLLFGIPPQTADNFRHPYPSLRIGASLAAADGRTIEFIRRKGKAKTLRAADDEAVLPDDALAPFLGGIDPPVFEQMFAIGHEDLVRGGQEIACGKGRIGEALFAAGAGLIRLHAVQQGLEQECAALFKPGGSTPRINQSLAAFKEVRRKQTETLLNERTWQTHHQALAEARDRMQQVRQSLAEIKQQAARLRRIRDGLPAMARRKEIAAALAGLENVPDLPDDFGEKRREAERDLGIAARDLERSRQLTESLGRRIEALAVPDALIQQAAAVEAVQHELGSYRKAQKDRPGLHGRMRTLQQQAAEKLAQIERDLSVEAADALRLSPAAVAEIQRLATAFERLTVRLESAATQRKKIENQHRLLERERASMPAPANVTALEAALQAAVDAGAMDNRVADLRAAAESMEGELQRGLLRQTLWNGPLAEIDALACPARETVERFDTLFTDARRRIEKLRDEKAAAQDEITRIQVELEAMQRAHQVPAESDLVAARSLRESGWALVRRRLAGEAVADADGFVGHFEGAAGLADAFEDSMRRADHIADRLRHEAERVSRKELLAARDRQFQEALTEIEKRLGAALEEHGSLEARWQDAWKPARIIPLSPPEMMAWLGGMEALRAKLSEWRKARTLMETAARTQSELESGLRQALVAAGVPPPAGGIPLSTIVQEARSHVKASHDARTQMASVDKALLQLGGERQEAAAAIAELETTLAGWRQDWRSSVARIGIDAAAGPAAALAVIDSLKEAAGLVREADDFRKRIDGIDRDATGFENRVGELVRSLAPELAAEPCDRAAELLNARLTAARQKDAERRSLTQQLAAAQKEGTDAEKRISRGTAAIEALCKEAACAGADALGEVERQAQARKALLAERNEVEKRLLDLGAGATVDAFVAEASAVAADGIGPEIEDLELEIERLEQERSALDQAIGTRKAELQRMDGSSEAAACAETAEALLARLEVDVAHYARLKIASVILAGTVEQYREKHQGPLIARAGALFARMTLGTFDRLRAEYDDKGNPVMVGVRAGTGEGVPVEGMSDGTADQLYLALRLASLERYLEGSEPLPFVVDDILLRFDDRRALATLEVLSDLAARTQVIFFTHHRHLVELAASRLAPSRLGVHELGAGTGPFPFSLPPSTESPTSSCTSTPPCG